MKTRIIARTIDGKIHEGVQNMNITNSKMDYKKLFDYKCTWILVGDTWLNNDHIVSIDFMEEDNKKSFKKWLQLTSKDNAKELAVEFYENVAKERIISAAENGRNFVKITLNHIEHNKYLNLFENKTFREKLMEISEINVKFITKNTGGYDFSISHHNYNKVISFDWSD